MEPAAKKPRVQQKYRAEYTKQWPCILKSADGDTFVRCSLCKVDLKNGNGGRADIERHLQTPKHKSREVDKKDSSQAQVTSFFKQSASTDADLDVAKAEPLFASFLVEHNIPLAVADHAGPLFRSMFPDSTIAKKYKSARTKTRQLVGVLAQESQQLTVSKLKDRPFSLSTDGSNDKGSEQLYPILLRYHDDTRVVNDVLTITSPSVSTGKEIFCALDRELAAAGLDWSKCISFGSDNASVMLGRLSGVAACIKEKNPEVHIQGCPCHLLHIAAKTGASALRCPIEERLVDIFYYLDGSSKRQKTLQTFQLETGTALRKILKHGPTRWLSLLSSINRLLEQWDALTAYFSAEPDSGRQPADRLKRIKEFLLDPVSKVYALFLSHSLPIFTNANLLLQREDPVLHLLQERLHEVATDILVSFIKPSAITSCENIYEIEHHRRSRQKERDEVSIGEATRRYLDAQKGTSLTNTAVAEFFEDVRSFYSSSLKYIFEKLPMNQEELEKAVVMDVSKRATAKFAHVRFWLSRFSCLKSGIDKVEELEKEFFKYQVDKLEGINPSERLDAVWGKIGDLKDSSGSVRYPLLTKFMKGLLAIPHSNADAERVFSLVRKNKTEARSSMSRQLLSDIIVQKMHMLSRDKVCHSLELSRAVPTKAK